MVKIHAPQVHVCCQYVVYGVPFVSKLHFSRDLVNNATDLLNNGLYSI